MEIVRNKSHDYYSVASLHAKTVRIREELNPVMHKSLQDKCDVLHQNLK